MHPMALLLIPALGLGIVYLWALALPRKEEPWQDTARTKRPDPSIPVLDYDAVSSRDIQITSLASGGFVEMIRPDGSRYYLRPRSPHNLDF